MTERLRDRLRFWESSEMREGRSLERFDFEKFGLSVEHVERLFADQSRAGIDRRRRIHRLGEAFQSILESGSAVPPEYRRLFEGNGPLDVPLPMTGRTFVESAFISPEEFDYAEGYLLDVSVDVASWLDA